MSERVCIGSESQTFGGRRASVSVHLVVVVASEQRPSIVDSTGISTSELATLGVANATT